MTRGCRVAFVAVPILVACGLPLLVGAVRAGAAQPGGGGAEGGPATGRASMAGIGQQLVAALQATPGCLGTEVAQTISGKFVIFGWFENKKAAVAWYESPTHQELMNKFFPGRKKDREPMQGVPDDAGPIMAVASLKMAPQGSVDGTGLPISQIAIELYEPLHAGITVNGSFSPESMKVEGRRDIRRQPAADDAGKTEGGGGR